MKKLLGALLALFSTLAFATSTVPVQLINPAGSSSGQGIVSTGASSAPAWGGIGMNGIAAIASNAVVANASSASASPSAFAMPSCSGGAAVLNWVTNSGFACNTSTALTVPIGGTGRTTLTAHGLLIGEGISAIDQAAAGTAGQILTSGGPSADPYWIGPGQPYFQAYLSANQSVTANTSTKIQWNTKAFDSGNYFDNTTNYRYTPLVAGKYKVTAVLLLQSSPAASGNNSFGSLMKDGAEVLGGVCTAQGTAAPNICTLTLSELVTMNGTSDYLEVNAQIAGNSTTVLGTATNSTFEAFYVGP